MTNGTGTIVSYKKLGKKCGKSLNTSAVSLTLNKWHLNTEDRQWKAQKKEKKNIKQLKQKQCANVHSNVYNYYNFPLFYYLFYCHFFLQTIYFHSLWCRGVVSSYYDICWKIFKDKVKSCLYLVFKGFLSWWLITIANEFE